MQVILLKDVPKIGRAHEVKNVNDGYAMNFLIPQKLAEISTPEKIKKLEERKKAVIIEKNIQEELLSKNLADLSGKEITITSRSNEKGHLFSAIHNDEIVAELLKEHRIQLDGNMIETEKPIKETGEHEITVSIGGKKTTFKLIVSNQK